MKRAIRLWPGIGLWIFVVYLVSFSCYAPMLLERLGAAVPDGLLSLRYGFVLAPALVSIAFLTHEHGLKYFFHQNIRRVSLKEWGLCIAAALTGILFTCVCLSASRNHAATYPTIPALAASCAYLFVTALVEETAWRGFFFRRTAAGGDGAAAAVLTGIVWAGWHIPMWSIRNGLGAAEMVPLFLWAVLLSLVLGLFYNKFTNLISAALLHMTFNVCFLAPMEYNAALLFAGIIFWRVIRKRR